MHLASVLIVLVYLACYCEAGGKGSKHEVLKIHVPEIIKHQYHTHYVFIHKYPKKPPPKKKGHHHKHVPAPHGHHHKHWSVHKSAHNHKSSHGHGHPVVKTVIKHHKPVHPPMKHKPHPKPHHPHHKPHHPKMHKHKPKPPKKHHDQHPINHEYSGYEVNEDHEPNYDPSDYNTPDDYSEDEDFGYEGEDLYSKPYYSFPPNVDYSNSGITSYDISPYYQVDQTNMQPVEMPMPTYDESLEIEHKPKFENEFTYHRNKFSHSDQESDTFGEAIPGFTQHKQFINEINHATHSTYGDGSGSKHFTDGETTLHDFNQGFYSTHF